MPLNISDSIPTVRGRASQRWFPFRMRSAITPPWRAGVCFLNRSSSSTKNKLELRRVEARRSTALFERQLCEAAALVQPTLKQITERRSGRKRFARSQRGPRNRIPQRSSANPAIGLGTGLLENRRATCFDVFTAATASSDGFAWFFASLRCEGLQQFRKRPQFGRSSDQTVARQRFKIIVG